MSYIELTLFYTDGVMQIQQRLPNNFPLLGSLINDTISRLSE